MAGTLLGAQSLWLPHGGVAAGTPEAYYLRGLPAEALAAYSGRAGGGAVRDALDSAQILRELGRNDEAGRVLRGALSAEPASAELRTELGWTLLAAGDTAGAAATLAELAPGPAKEPRALLGLALALHRSGDSGAVKRLKAAGKQPGLAALAAYFSGLDLMKAGDRDGAERSFLAALKADSHFAEARLPLAGLYEEGRRFDEAWRQYAKLAQVDPLNRPAAAAKARLLPLLSKKPEELLPARKLKSFTGVKPAPGRREMLELRVGIGTTSGGKPQYRRSVSFRASGAFSVYETAGGKELASGESGETWTVDFGGAGTSSPHASDNVPGPARFPAPAQAVLRGPSGGAGIPFSGGVTVRLREPGAGTIIAAAVPYGAGSAWGGSADKELRGGLEINCRAGKGLFLVNLVPVEEYLLKYKDTAARLIFQYATEKMTPEGKARFRREKK